MDVGKSDNDLKGPDKQQIQAKAVKEQGRELGRSSVRSRRAGGLSGLALLAQATSSHRYLGQMDRWCHRLCCRLWATKPRFSLKNHDGQ